MNSKDISSKRDQVYLIVNFVVDTITSLYNQILQYRDFDYNPEEDENLQILKIINDNLIFICREENLEVTKNLINLCFKKKFLNINFAYEVGYPKFELFVDPIESLSKSDDKDLNEIIMVYAEYIKKDGAFMSQADLNILKSLEIFKDFKEDIGNSTISQYSAENSHIGGSKIKSDGNCLLSSFIFEYLKKKELISIAKSELEYSKLKELINAGNN